MIRCSKAIWSEGRRLKHEEVRLARNFLSRLELEKLLRVILKFLILEFLNVQSLLCQWHPIWREKNRLIFNSVSGDFQATNFMLQELSALQLKLYLGKVTIMWRKMLCESKNKNYNNEKKDLSLLLTQEQVFKDCWTIFTECHHH